MQARTPDGLNNDSNPNAKTKFDLDMDKLKIEIKIRRAKIVTYASCCLFACVTGPYICHQKSKLAKLEKQAQQDKPATPKL